MDENRGRRGQAASLPIRSRGYRPYGRVRPGRWFLFRLTPTKVKVVGRCPTPCKLFEKSLSKNFTLASLGTPPLGLHCIYTMRNSGWLNSTTWPLPTQISATVPSSSAGISFISFMASMMHSVSPFFTWSPTSTKGRASGLGAE